MEWKEKNESLIGSGVSVIANFGAAVQLNFLFECTDYYCLSQWNQDNFFYLLLEH
jgi:hypothetical protein